MNLPVPKPQIMAGGAVAALVPQSLDEAFRVAQAIASSGMAPKGMEKPEQCMVAMMAGAELGMAPFQAIQSFAVVNGRPTIWGDGMLAVVLKNGFGVKEWMEKESDAFPDDMTAYCEVTRPDNGEVKRGKFSVADAKKANLWSKGGPWQTAPKRMLQMRARAFACRDGAADVLRGFQMREEVEDYQPIRDITPTTGMRARLEARGSARSQGFDPDHVSAELDRTLDGDAEPDSATEAPAVSDTSAPATVADEAARAGVDEGFPGDRPPPTPGETTAGSAEPNGNEGTEPAVDPVIVWQSRLIEDMDGLTGEQLDHLLANPSDQEMFAELERDQAQLAMDLNKAITRRRKELS